MKYILKILAGFLLVGLFSLQGLKAEDWVVPSNAKNKKNPYGISRKNISQGKKAYLTNCKSCHGDPTKNNAMPLVPRPTDLGSQSFLVQTDGDIYYKIQTGRAAMPTFAKTLSDEAKWMIISYLRSFDKNKKKSNLTQEIENPEVKHAFLKIDIDDEDHKIIAHLTGETPKGKLVNLQSVELEALVKRQFGQLIVSGDNAYTDENGKLEIPFPHDLPGNKEGDVDLTVKVSDDDLYGKLEVKLVSRLGVPTNPINPLIERAMWGTRAKAPIWIIATFSFVVIGIWSVILLIIFQAFKLRRMARKKD